MFTYLKKKIHEDKILFILRCILIIVIAKWLSLIIF